MEPTFQLTPESARALAMRLFTKEQFAAKPRACIVAALDWLDRAAGDAPPAESPTPQGNPLIARLDSIVAEQGLDTVARRLEVSVNAVRSWQHGGQPNAVNLEKIRKFLQDHETSLTAAAGAAESARSGELFDRPQPSESAST
jgi:hypothetical protein